MQKDEGFTTGELARKCGTTVRTVQYYDSKGLLSPSERSEGGRRIYSKEDVEQMNFILMLKFFGLGLNQIKGVLDSPHRETILFALLDERAKSLSDEIISIKKRLTAIETMRADLSSFGKILVFDKDSMTLRMEDPSARRKWTVITIVAGVLMDAIWIGMLVLGILTGVWWPFFVALIAVIVAATWLLWRLNNHVMYFCPSCKEEFSPRFREFMFAYHTPKTRKLTCPHCGVKNWCVERFHVKSVGR